MPAPRRSPRTSTRSPASTRRSQATSIRATERVPRYRFVGGKGGVGKTTCAAAIAVASATAGARTLVISTDPAPSLGDALKRPLSATPRRIPLGRGLLDAVEIDAPRALDLWLAPRRATLAEIAHRGTWLDRDDVSQLLRLSLPGIDELAALLEIARFGRAGRYDAIIVDTAPTGHTLRMLAMPETLRGVARVFDRMQAKHRILVEALRGRWTPDDADRIIEEIGGEGEALAALLRDPAQSRVSWVTLPESMAVEETADAAVALAAAGIPLRDVIVNRLTAPPTRRCGWCLARRALERRAVVQMHARLPGVPLTGVMARSTDPRGAQSLARIGTELAAARSIEPEGRARAVPRWRPALRPAARDDLLDLVAGEETRLVLFGGKGGVGKTTCAAAAALALAGTRPARRVVLISTDPAHSLADVFATPPSARQRRRWPPSLVVRELDAGREFDAIRARYAAAIDAVFDRLTSGRSGFDAGHDRQVMQGLIDLAPPGIDELAAVLDVTDAIESGDLVVMDTAPTGHALRLLEMPALVQDWTRALMAMLLKYQPVVGVGELGAVLLKLSQGLGRLRTLLADPARTSFVLVTRAAILPRAETVRLARRLRKMHIHVPVAIVNAAGRGTCPACRAAAVIEGQEIGRLARALRPIPIAVAPSELPPPRGAAALSRWQRRWRPAARPGAGISSTRTS